MQLQGVSASTRDGLLPEVCRQIAPNPQEMRPQRLRQNPPNMILMHLPAMGGRSRAGALVRALKSYLVGFASAFYQGAAFPGGLRRSDGTPRGVIRHVYLLRPPVAALLLRIVVHCRKESI